jgi:RNA polymerase sigma-70 factor, ECF subfamily
MNTLKNIHEVGEQPDVTATVQTGSERSFALLTEPHRRELRVHCYRLVGNLDDADDLVQETFLRAWRSRTGFQGRSSLRAWLYRIATNACLDSIKAKRRRLRHSSPAGAPGSPPSFDDVPWLQPIPDHLFSHLTSTDGDP